MPTGYIIQMVSKICKVLCNSYFSIKYIQTLLSGMLKNYSYLTVRNMYSKSSSVSRKKLCKISHSIADVATITSDASKAKLLICEKADEKSSSVILIIRDEQACMKKKVGTH